MLHFTLGMRKDSTTETKTVKKVPQKIVATSFFEGVEKLLEVWFTREDGDIESGDLRKIPM